MDVSGTKKCPECAEEIKAEALVCRYCGARFAVTRRGYCTSCHRVVSPVVDGRCPECGGPVVDEVLESRFVGAGDRPAPVAAAATPVPPTVPAPPPADLAGPGPSLEGVIRERSVASPPTPEEAAAVPWAVPAGSAVEGPPPPVTGEEGRRGRGGWLPWVIAAVILVGAGGGVLTWWLLRGDDGGAPVASTTSVPEAEIDALAAYLTGLLEAEMPVGEAAAAANNVATTREAAQAQRDLADAFAVYAIVVGRLAPPPSALEHRQMVLEMAEGAVDLYRRAAEATEEGDTAALIGLQADLLAWMDLALAEVTQRELLLNTALVADADLPLNAFLLETGAIRTAAFADLQAFLGRVQTVLAAGQWQAGIDQIEEETGIIDRFLADWEQVTPPAEAAAYHAAQAEAARSISDQLDRLASALVSRDLTAVQGALVGLTRAVAEGQQALLLRNELIIQALGGVAAGAFPPAGAFPLAGTWSGSAATGGGGTWVTITIQASCEEGQVCGSFDLPDLPCSGSYTYVGQQSAEGPHEFRAGDLVGACGEGRDFLGLLEDGTLQYTAVGDWGTTAGILTRVGS